MMLSDHMKKRQISYSPHKIYSIYAHIMSEPRFNNFYRMADYDGNAPFITMALYETADVLGYGTEGKQFDASGNEISDEGFEEEDWKMLILMQSLLQT